MKDDTGNFVAEQTRVSLLHIIHISRLLEVLHEDNRAIVRAASAASKAADYLLSFCPGAVVSLDSEQVSGMMHAALGSLLRLTLP